MATPPGALPVPVTPLAPAIDPAAYAKPAKSIAGWNALMHAVASDLPTAHMRAVRLRRAARQALR